MTSTLKKIEKAIVTLVVCLLALPVVADDNHLQPEIDHLIKSIRNSDCAFIRNGKAHSSAVAIEHILKKYEHFKDKIKTSEDFIDHCASKSLLSNRPYQISCPGQAVVDSKTWFRKELKRYRSQ